MVDARIEVRRGSDQPLLRHPLMEVVEERKGEISRWMDGWMDRRMDGWMDGWMDKTNGLFCISINKI